MKTPSYETLVLDKIVNGGQALGALSDGRKAFVWGGLPGETATVRIVKKKSRFVEATVTEVLKASTERIAPKDPDSYLSTSPWQIMSFDAEQRHKAQLIKEAFVLHNIQLPSQVTVFTDGVELGYRNKAEFSWYGQESSDGSEALDLAFFRRGGKGKVIVTQSAIMPASILNLASHLRDLLQSKQIAARSLKTLLVRSNQQGECVWQLYTKDMLKNLFSEQDISKLPALGGEVIYSDPKSPASRITKRLNSYGQTTLNDKVLGVSFNYATEGFFQINIPVYERALTDMKEWIPRGSHVLDLYSGVGSIGLTIGGDAPQLVEINEHAVREMKQNIKLLNSNASAILAASEEALDYITSDKIVVVDPPRAGLHKKIINKLLQELPERIIYLSCNPVTQARDVEHLLTRYNISHQKGYNFFPRTPHIENLIVLQKQLQP